MTALSLRAALRTAGTGALLALLVTAGATAAAAHDELLDSSPGTDEHLDVAPTHVTLSFSDEILTIGPAVIVADTDGTTWTAGDPTLEGSAVVVPLADDVPDGSYEIRWRVVSSDGHPISGLVPFTIGDATEVEPSAPSEPTAAPEPAPSAPPAAEAPDQDAAGTPADSSTSPSWLRPVLVGATGALVATSLFWVSSRLTRRRTAASSTATSITPSDGPA
ncbi:copper resistance CopC family protein [Sanguibacter sp. 25GB23B1]|uniref:copper resistance CopC family protein n=1 Tax=unclassified Sanguibacter TaxID=2645534 RepID=UPI0032AFB7D1